MNENNPQSPDNKFTRRDFIRTTSTAAIGGSLVAATNAFAAEDRSPTKGQGAADLTKRKDSPVDDTLKIALIGCGGRGSGAASQALSTEGKIKLVAMADTFGNRLESSLAILK